MYLLNKHMLKGFPSDAARTTEVSHQVPNLYLSLFAFQILATDDMSLYLITCNQMVVTQSGT